MPAPRTALHRLTAAEAAALIATRELSPVDLLGSLLARIEATEPALRAWEVIDVERALAAARAAEEAVGRALRAGGRPPAPLFGIPFGVKDVIDVAGLPTGCGFEPFRARPAEADAGAVARLRGAGAIVLGKTATTQFAFRDPPPTRNPWREDRSPGGSSTGSAVAVAAGHVPFALGTQTSGSVLRPAAFNGVVGFKPTFGRVGRRGVFPAAWSLDHVGVLARSVEDCRLFLAAAEGPDAGDPASTSPAAGPRGAGAALPPRLGLLTAALDGSSAEVREHVTDAARRLEAAGARVEEVGSLPSLELAEAIQQVTMQCEMADLHRRLRRLHPDSYRPHLRAYLDVGAQLPGWAYVHAQRLRRRLALEMGRALDRHHALLLPTCVGVAPPVAAGTGDASLQAPFTLLGLPALSLPAPPGREGLPLAVQLVGRRGDDLGLLAVAAWCEERLPRPGPPPGLD
ncbi:MAG TPA: amidase [Candidatus Dormibacteraeota bacterium]|jgi:aspartyl-tRNA(Asn)/glutamyl-tRNA(Gln) amidotransferase subunit A|nr:amidase [Candidatus Dormibacteraeota bacterium]